MITNQFTHYLANSSCKTIDNSSVTRTKANVGSVLYDQNYSYKANSAKWLDVGFGSTLEDPDQYCLANSNAAAGTLTCTSQSSETKESDDIFACSAVFTNSSGSEVTVTEIGLFAGGISGEETGYTDCVMFARVKLEAPVTIANGETKAFALHIGLND